MFRRLAAVIAPAPPPPTVMEIARQRLRNAIAACAPAEQALNEAVATLQRVKDLIEAAETASDEAAIAEAAAADSARIWATAGARIGTPAGDQDLLDRATDAKRRAHQAKIQADGAEAALSAVRAAEHDAQIAARQAGEAVQAAVRNVLIASLEDVFERLGEAREVYQQSLTEISALRAVLRMSTNLYPFAGGSEELGSRLRALAIVEPRDADLRALKASFADWGERLATDPDSEL